MKIDIVPHSNAVLMVYSIMDVDSDTILKDRIVFNGRPRTVHVSFPMYKLTLTQTEINSD
jgi:hypothetical protein